ncbi:hypothetical protein K469DRAFT_596657 [Zopfia rhizophila CBS 207.26]|uniref:HypA-like protein n=1 Tax=Zopfia rhizophila CBS 207.26 TaxID=1314779 RepID=A0A6A6DLM4_9PEZI|nr:hypothetical protein K469DRAFT_596657 [Zopfia rhizophila CBS 207.26]
MATASNIALTGNEKLAFAVTPLRLDSAKKASQLLNENHKKYDIYINDLGHHNHILHHVLTLYALGASPDQIQAAYDSDTPYQRPAFPPHQKIIQELRDLAGFAKYLGDYTQYSNYLAHFTAEIDAKGVTAVVAEYLFAGDERANDLLARNFTGFAHALIHLGYGLEFGQPAIVAEALAQASVHEPWARDFFLAAEKAGEERKQSGDRDVALLELFGETRRQIEQLPTAAKYEYADNGLKYGIVHIAAEHLLPVLSKWAVRSDELIRKTAEMIDASVFYNVTAQRPPHLHKLDFFYVHSITLSVHFTDFLTNPVLSPEARVRLLEWKGRWDLANYASRGAAPLLPNELINYTPKNGGDSWERLIERTNKFIHVEDGGHAPKMMRALVNGWKACEKEDRSGFGLKTPDLWLKAAAMGMDAVESGSPVWVRGAGFNQGWVGVPLRKGKS